MSVELEGFDELRELINQLEKVPQKVATKAARAGGQIELSAAKSAAPVYDGWLKAALKMVAEPSKKGETKKVYQITFDRVYNSKLVKFGSTPLGMLGETSEDKPRSYYPNSQEFGWNYGGFHPGLHYMKNTANSESNAVEQQIINVALTEIEKVLYGVR